MCVEGRKTKNKPRHLDEDKAQAGFQFKYDFQNLLNSNSLLQNEGKFWSSKKCD